ncbi:MAG TPA: dynamin family protein [Candidatus Acidoferrales bacterium]|nr:dynamin family protein [Candidatus Acidoferrales bacterium]
MMVEVGSESTVGTPPDNQASDVRALGALATRLNEAIGRARHALDPHAALLPDGTLGSLDALLAEFARRRIRVAIYGEVKAGKSTLLNAIAGATLSPVAFEPLTSIPVRVTYGEHTAWRVGDHQLESVADLEGVMRTGLAHANGSGAPEVVVETNLDLLELGGQVDLLDTPGVGSAAQFDAVSAEALRALDAVVLVVRYPALFTQFTRGLMDHLQTDIGKLFVVWNLDADCAELTADERVRHAETLRANVAGAHELFLVDARAAFRAMQDDDAMASVASGLTPLIAALRRFASSRAREVAALREAAKGAALTLATAQRCLVDRNASLERAVADARARLEAVQAAANAEAAAARTQLANFEAALGRIGQEVTSTAARRVTELRQQLRLARRRWMRSGDLMALEAGTTAATSRFADAVAAASRTAMQAVQNEGTRFGTEIPETPYAYTQPSAAPLTSDERTTQATTGRGQWLRRTVWNRWYLPGLATLEREGIAAAQHAHAAWLTTMSQAARDAAGATLASRLAEMARRADAEQEQIKIETHFTACATELARLGQAMPIVAAQSQSVAQLATEARALL